MPILYIVAIGWIYVVLMMSVAETSFIAGIATFLFYGVLPLGVILYLMNTPKRRAMRAEAEKLRRVQMQQRHLADVEGAPAKDGQQEFKPDP
jgi:predicted membrane channel-forming protein YqfA (hemolysin III family)